MAHLSYQPQVLYFRALYLCLTNELVPSAHTLLPTKGHFLLDSCSMFCFIFKGNLQEPCPLGAGYQSILKNSMCVLCGQQSHCQQELLEMGFCHSMCMQGLSKVRMDLVIEISVFPPGDFVTSKGRPGSWRSQREPEACLLPGNQKENQGRKVVLVWEVHL